MSLHLTDIRKAAAAGLAMLMMLPFSASAEKAKTKAVSLYPGEKIILFSSLRPKTEEKNIVSIKAVSSAKSEKKTAKQKKQSEKSKNSHGSLSTGKAKKKSNQKKAAGKVVSLSADREKIKSPSGRRKRGHSKDSSQKKTAKKKASGKKRQKKAARKYAVTAQNKGHATVMTSDCRYKITVKTDADDGKTIYHQSSWAPLLNSQLRNATEQSIINHDRKIDISSLDITLQQSTDMMLADSVSAVEMMNPELFCLKGSFTGHYDERTEKMLDIVPAYKQTKEEYDTQKAQLDSAVSLILKKASVRKGTKAKITEVNNIMKKKIRYKLKGLHTDDAYGALVEGKALCMGYAKAFSLLMSKMNIRSRYRYSDSGDHIWNEVYLNGRWLTVDVTWNDSMDENCNLLSKRHYDPDADDEPAPFVKITK